MTDAMKIKHACAVISALENRFGASIGARTQSLVGNIKDLRLLLEKPHVTDKTRQIEEGRAGPTWADALLLSRRLGEHILERKANFRKIDLVSWAKDMDKILRIDKRTSEQLEAVIDWCQQDDFWSDNILSPSKLRKQLDKLELRMKRDKLWQRTRRLCRPESAGKSAKDKYLEALNAKDS